MYIKKKRLSSRQPIFIANLKSNTMKNTVQKYVFYVIQHNKEVNFTLNLAIFSCFQILFKGC